MKLRVDLRENGDEEVQEEDVGHEQVEGGEDGNEHIVFRTQAPVRLVLGAVDARRSFTFGGSTCNGKT